MNSGHTFEFYVTDSGPILEELSNSGAIPVESGHSSGFRCHSGRFQCHSGGITGFWMESVGHCKVLNKIDVLLDYSDHKHYLGGFFPGLQNLSLQSLSVLQFVFY